MNTLEESPPTSTGPVLAQMLPGLRVGFVIIAWMAALAVPSPDSARTKESIVFAVLGVLFTAVAVVIAWYALPFRSWAALGVSWPGGIRLLAAAVAYVAVMQLSSQVTGQLVEALDAPTGDFPGSGIPDPARLPGDLAGTIQTSFIEEFVLFAIPICCAALALRRWGSRRWARLLIVAATLIVVVGARFGVHLWGGAEAFRVFPWMVGAWLIYRWCRSVWPLVLGHIVYDTLVHLEERLPDQRWPAAVFYGLIFAGVLLLPVLYCYRRGGVGASA